MAHLRFTRKEQVTCSLYKEVWVTNLLSDESTNPSNTVGVYSQEEHNETKDKISEPKISVRIYISTEILASARVT